MEQQRNDLHIDNVSNPLGMDKAFVFSCPYLGTIQDSDTSLAYPAVANHCFRVDSPAAIELSHQESYCLSDQHPNCHVFQMVSAAVADPEPEVVQAAPEKTKRRLSLFALPIILVLILLAAIIWWPAPGTTIQDSLVMGAQNDREISGGATLTGKPAPQLTETDNTVADSAVANTAPDTVAESENNTSLNDSGAEGKAAGSNTSTSATNRNNDTGIDLLQPPPRTNAETDQLVESTVETETSTSSAQSAADMVLETEVINKETSSADEEQNTEEQTTVVDTAETASDSSSSVEETTASDVVETIAAAVEEKSDQETDAEEAEESKPLVTSDLPVISTNATAVTTTPTETVAVNDTGQQVFLVGPATSTALSLGQSSEDASFIPVYQEIGNGQILSQIETRQFITLLGRDESRTWLNIRLANGAEGWINADQSGIAADADAPSAAAEQAANVATSYPVIRYAYVDTGALYLRSGPGVEYDSLSILSRGEIVGLLGRRTLGPWVRISLDSGVEGWVNSSLLAPIS